MKYLAIVVLILSAFTACEIETPFRTKEPEEKPITYADIANDIAAGKKHHIGQTYTIEATVSWLEIIKKNSGEEYKILLKRKNGVVWFYVYHYYQEWDPRPYYKRDETYTMRIRIIEINSRGSTYIVVCRVVEEE